MGEQAPAAPRGAAFYVLLAVLVIGIFGIGIVIGTNLQQSQQPATPTPQVEGVTVYEPPVPLNSFSLTDQNRETVTLETLKGKPTLIFFGYTHCPDFCPLTLDTFKRVRQTLGEQGDALNYVFVSVDGTRDTPERLADYLEVRGVQDFVTALTGSEDDVALIGRDYGLFFERSQATIDQENYLVDHTTRTYLIDAEGRLRVIYAFETPPDVIAASVQEQL